MNDLVKWAKKGKRGGRVRGQEFIATIDQTVVHIEPKVNVRIRECLYVDSTFFDLNIRSIASNDYNGKWLYASQ